MPDPNPYPLLHSQTHNFPLAARYNNKVGALRLIADSVAQQRQSASRTLIMHSLNKSFTLLVLATLAQYVSSAIFFTTSAGVIMAMLVAGGSGCMFPAKGEDENKVVKGDETVILIMKLEEEIIVMVVAKVLKKEKRGL
ncbi:hypothetical protein MMC31_007301, partial [Peltigera leucophlebia]|nr:hypothetical protein [Peltigera leucophlebia]